MNHKEIRFRILFTLYKKHYSNQLGHPQITQKLIDDAGLQYVEKDLVYGDIVYLKESNLVKGMDILGQAYPYSLIITPNGIDMVDKMLNCLLEILKQDSVQDYTLIESIGSYSAKFDEIWRIIKQNKDISQKFFAKEKL